MNEHFLRFTSGKNELGAVLHQAQGETGVLLIVGGPQYRVGSHRQFVKLSRYLATQNIASLRLDTAGMGDSSGEKASFYQQSEDIRTAIEQFMAACPHIRKLVLWGLCDAASAILMQLNQPDPRITGVVLLNPWVRQVQSHAQTMLKHYYLQRLFSRQFWHKLLRGGLQFGNSLRGLKQTLAASKQKNAASTANTLNAQSYNEQNYVNAMLSGWQQFHQPVLVITSGNDLTAQEFLQLCQQHPDWQTQLKQAQHQHIADATHTFSSQQWRQQVETLTAAFVQQLK